VTEPLVKSQNAFNLRDALKNVSGLTIAAAEGGRTGDSINVRGFAANSDFYLDGVKDSGQYVRDSFFIERVEVLKGPQGTLFGSSVSAGVLNITTRAPKIDETSGYVSGEFGIRGLGAEYSRSVLRGAAGHRRAAASSRDPSH